MDLSGYAPGPVRVRFRMLADEFLGGLGWFVDRVRVTYPGATTSVPVAIAPIEAGPPRPNPARGALRQAIVLAAPAHGEWMLFDLAGRRVATLWRGTIPAGGLDVSASVPSALPNGLYFTRLAVDGREVRSDRVALIR